MRARNFVIAALPFLVTCDDGAQTPSPTIETQRSALGKVPSSEVAVWQKVGSSDIPEGRFLPAVAFDAKREVVVMFGGEAFSLSSMSPPCNQEIWEWSLATGKWSNRSGTGTAPGARAGAAMVYDSTDNMFVLFGGRTTSGVNYEDTWEWDPTTGVWTDRTDAGAHPSARSQHGMVYEKSAGKILLYGGGSGTGSAQDGATVSTSLKDTWEYDPGTHSWTAHSTATGPGARHDFGLVWDADRKKVILFGGLQVDPAGAAPVAKQDTWEWDPAGTWTERTVSGTKPSARFGHAMAYDGSRKKVVVFGGLDPSASGAKNDLWDLDPTAAAWTQRLLGSEAGLPTPRMYASLVSDDSKARLELLAGAVAASGSSSVSIAGSYAASGSNEVWELDPAPPTFTNKTLSQTLPAPRCEHAMAYNPTTHKTYLFGGYEGYSETAPSPTFNDFWEWDGKVWTQVVTSNGPSPAYGAALAYDPVRKSLILYGGLDYDGLDNPVTYGDTWEWSSSTRQWTKLTTTGNPGPLYEHGMVTDTTRGKILLLTGSAGPWINNVWEWDGSSLSWTDRTLVSLATAARSRSYPLMAYDEDRQKLLLYDGVYGGGSGQTPASAFWEWDPITAGWTPRDSGDTLDTAHGFILTYDSIRRRVIMLTDAPNGYARETWELDVNTPMWYVRTLSTSPTNRYQSAMAFDSDRGVAVLFGGMLSGVAGSAIGNDTWEYSVTNLANGEGCNAAFAASCASGNCVDGVCCEATTCTGACKSCSVPGSEGTCKLAQAGMEVPGSCGDGNACDGTGTCKTKNGQSCSEGATCASGFCADGVCCDSACTGTCVACNLSGRTGKCSAHPAGTDPGNECTAGTGLCKSTCDGAGACAFTAANEPCDTCTTCDGKGNCSQHWPEDVCKAMSASNGGTTGTTTSIDKSKGGAGGFSSGAGGMVGAGGGNGGTGGSAAGGSASGGSAAGGRGGAGAGGTTGPGGSGGSGNGGSSTSSSSSTGKGGNAAGAGGTTHGGAGGSSTTGAGGSAGNGGSTANRDGSVAADGGLVGSLHRSGCSCAVGQAQSPHPEWFPPFVLVGAALVARWLRRRHLSRVYSRNQGAQP